MPTTVKDLVCGIEIDSVTVAGRSENKGQTYYFCSMGCMRDFNKHPEKYIDKEELSTH